MFNVYNCFYCCFWIFGISTVSSISTRFDWKIKNISSNLHISYSNLTAESNSSNVTNYPKKPQNFKIEYITSKIIKLKWEIDHGSLEFLTGFGLEVICLSGICNIPESKKYNLDLINDQKTDFELELAISYGSQEIVLSTLPYKNSCQNTIRRTPVILIADEPPNWKFPFFIFSQQNQNLEVNFPVAPKEYWINKYKICLKNNTNSTRCSIFENSPAKFGNVQNGRYDVMVKAFNDSAEDEDDYNCTNCIITEIGYTADYEICETNNDYVYPLLVGIFIAIFSILIIALLFFISRLKGQNFDKKLILLLHTVDNRFHAKTVDNFIKCLEYFNISVHRVTSMNNQEQLSWLISSFDNVLLIDSIALGRRQEAWAVGKDYRQFLVESNSKELTKSLFSAIGTCLNPSKKEYFLRCKWNFVPEDAEFKNYPIDEQSIVIPDDFKNLIEIIQGCSVDTNACKTEISILKDSIIEELKFIKENPNWFSEKYGTPTNIEIEAAEVLDHCPPHPVLNDLISHVSSQLQKLNESTDNNLGRNHLNGSRLDEMSV